MHYDRPTKSVPGHVSAHRQDRRQVHVQHRHGRTQQSVDDRLFQAVLRQDLGCLESYFAGFDVHFELADLQAVVGPSDRFGDRRPSAFGNPHGRVAEDLEQVGLPYTRPRRAVRNVRNMTPFSGFRFRHPAEESNPVLQNRSLLCCPAHSQGKSPRSIPTWTRTRVWTFGGSNVIRYTIGTSSASRPGIEPGPGP
jgi:hypothetical protein